MKSLIQVNENSVGRLKELRKVNNRGSTAEKSRAETKIVARQKEHALRLRKKFNEAMISHQRVRKKVYRILDDL